MNMVSNATHRQGRNPILPPDAAKIGMKSVTHIVVNRAPSPGGGKDDMHQATNVAMRHVPNP
jgi:hypothetical protein